MIIKIIFFLLTGLYISCSKDHFPQVNTAPCAIHTKIPKLQQGLYGRIYYKHGNCMPTIDPVTQTCKTECIRTELYLTAPVKYSIHTHPYYSNLPAPVREIIHSNTEGYFESICPSGMYSVFVKWNNMYYAQNISAEGFVNLINITTDSIVNADFTIDEAVY